MIEETKSLTWYFGYGSNMNRGIFENRRGMLNPSTGPNRLPPSDVHSTTLLLFTRHDTREHNPFDSPL